MDSIKAQLLSMGFSEEKVKKALNSCPEASNIEQVMEWLIAHESELESKPSDDDPVILPSPNQPPQVKDDKTSNTSENDKAIIDKDKALKLITERQLKRADEERKRDIEDEKRRRIDGQKIAQTRAELQDQERIRLAQEIRREKLEKEAHKRQVLEQIARDREAMKNGAAKALPTATNLASSSSDQKKSQPSLAPKDCRIALRFADGSNLVKTFSPTDKLSAVKDYVQDSKNLRQKISFVSPPNKVFNESSMKESLVDLGLCPASRLEVKCEAGTWIDEEVQCLD